MRLKKNEKVLKKLSSTDSPQGFIAVFEKKVQEQDLAFSKLSLYCERIQDPGNLGSIIRTALAAGCNNIFCESCVDMYNPKLIRASAGTIFHVKIIETNLESIQEHSSRNNLKLLASSPKAKNNYEQLEIEDSKKYILMLGNEGQGLSQDALNTADIKLKIKINPQVESLNVLAASTLLLFELQKKLCII